MGVALALWTAVTLACGQARLPVRQQPPWHDFLIVGHQGAPNQACENTLESFEEALRLGANALELDVSMTSGRHVVLWHDWVPSIKAELRPTGVFSAPCRPCSSITRCTKPCSSHRMRRSFTGCVTKRSAGARPHMHTWKLPSIPKDPSSYS
jgi:glycerophosphoryl diester phosphodiesterase